METFIYIQSQKNQTYKEALKDFTNEKPLRLKSKRVSGVLTVIGEIV